MRSPSLGPRVATPRKRLAAHATAWITLVAACVTAMGDDPEGEAGAPAPLAKLEKFSADQRDHWAYLPLEPSEPPEVEESGWIRNPIDRFILADLELAELPHSPEADRAELLRRVTFDLTGLPPTPDEAAAFLADDRDDAYERVVDRLLDSPRFGERWGQHWLDLAHFADSNGFELDAERPDAWRYRDWVIDALNADMPYDRFVALQIAGDEIARGDRDALIATGFCRSGPREVVGGNIIPEVRRQNELTEITATVGSVFLGLTIGCARCHDHKFDAIPTTDYYRLQAFFAASELTEPSLAEPAEVEAFEAAKKAIDAKTAPLKQEMATLEAPYREAIAAERRAMLSAEENALLAIPEKERTPEQVRIANGLANSIRVTWEDVAHAVSKNPEDFARRESLKLRIHEIARTLPRPPAHAMALTDGSATPPDSFVHRRGDPLSKGPRVEPRPPGVILVSQRPDAFTEGSIQGDETSSGRRAALARWLSDSGNPLVARVIVNRLWQNHFVRGLVMTPSDFGVRGEPPSHPELLDWLAARLIDDGWRLKPMHRLMVTSAVYRQSSRPIPKLTELDEENSLLGRMNRRRLDAEGLRDALLAVSGELNLKSGGPGVLAPLEKEVKDLIFTEAEEVDLWPVDPDPTEHHRRSIYLFKKRNVRYPLLESFDAPDNQTSCPRRETSTHALQALNLLNGDMALDRAHALAERLHREAPGSPADRIRRAYTVVLNRAPSDDELTHATTFLDGQRSTYGEAAAWDDFALALINSNEFLYIP
ncbi:DUF1549 and DUF1553 domain-containing protein [Planctomyces sp. SH-PL62]|uniref:DUF1549 and DUF1553 domain-containing protein n=1 Tax=Planctomyces sp. SH-PL62 TaxID=1636152 RepID=UPI00078D3CD1|nr:DUF1549 and DUF1553 domain-containing protein [Planctomyces sp. SH-PL62]AMV39550.1 hypothetical protein VT85_19090 [Planctomyces sp. SH-PL62]